LNGMDYIDPNAVADDGDDGLEYHNPKRRSMISLNRRSIQSSTALAGAGAGAAALGAGGSSANLPRSQSGFPNTTRDLPEKSSTFPDLSPDNEIKGRRWKKFLFFFLGVLILGAIAAGVAVGIIEHNKSANSGGSGSGSQNALAGVDGPLLDANSPSVKKLMNNKNLHKVFMGMAYTPMNTQYPACLTNPPVQNNVTLDIALISQLTNVVRLYGTDCNQTEMVLTAIDRLKLTDMKVWLGVWLNANATTTTRQVAQLWDILDKYGTKYVKGVIVGNEVLFSQYMTLSQLTTYISGVKTNLTAKGYNNIPVATSDLGSDWTTELVSTVDYVMANVHPFFGGVPVAQAADWTYNFWQTNDVYLTQGTTGKHNVISEVGWPSQGGNDCAPSSTCPSPTAGAVSGINEMNTFMNGWVCQSIKNQTDYFWFEAFDEPWKIQYDTPGQEWEDHWGLFDVNRNLKQGLTIPSCGGQTVPSLR